MSGFADGPWRPAVARKTLYLIDGHAQIYRAYYAPFGALTAPTGEPTRAVHVFVQMLLNILRDRKPDYLAMTMDTSDETVFRREIDPTYKSNRQPPPEDMPPQIDRIVSILQLMKVPILRLPGFEADDILATLCEQYGGENLDLFLVSRDKDLDQLLGEHVRMYDPAKDRDIDVASMREEKGYGPDQAIEAQMLMGDSTDNVKGVLGVGPKKAAQLLQQHGSLSEILAHADDLSPKLRENILAFRDRMDTVRRLVTLRRDVPISLDLSEADVRRFNPMAAAGILRELGLNRLLERVGDSTSSAAAAAPAKAAGSPAPAPTRISESLFGDETESDAAELPTGLIDADRGGAQYRLVDTDHSLAAFAKELAGVEAFAFDTETTSLVPAAADLVGLSFSWRAGDGCYIPVRGVGNTVSVDAVRKHLGPIFADEKIRKCGQNLKYDLGVLKGIGLSVAGVDFDTMIASFVLDSTRRSHGIDALAHDLLHYRKITTEEMIGKGKHQITFDKLPTDRTCRYASEDADIAWRLRQVLERQMTDPGLLSLFRDLEIPLVEVLAQMEFLGVAVDTDLLAKLSNEMADRLTELEHEIHKAAGHPFNIASTKQLAEVLFDEQGLKSAKRTKTGRSTDAEVLADLAVETDNPVPKLVLEHRELSKLKGTYIDALPEMVCSRTGRIHPSYHQTGAVTGRLSCSDPNLQNIPIRTEAGAQIRRAFVPGHNNCLLLKADYSQIELRVLAHMSGDKALATAFHEDRDIHAFVASQIEGIPLADVTKEQRSRAKTVNFGIVYGQSAFGLSRQTGMPVGQAKQFIDRYFLRYPRIRGFLDECVAHARRCGYVTTMLGRRRAIPDINSRNQTARSAAERFAANTVIQGSAADLIKRAMINIDRRIRRENRPSKMLIQVHDELVFEVPKKAVREEAGMIADEMSNAIAMNVPIKVDTGCGPNWLDLEPVDEK
jgi:DNA polymerase I